MSTSSARPDDLDKFVGGSRALDRELASSATKLITAHNEFVNGTRWGQLDAVSLLRALDPQFLAANEEDALRVQTIANDFRRAGGGGRISSLPDAAIAASLRQARISDTRASVTFDEPVAYGVPPTSGYADDPVNTASGNFVKIETDLPFSGLLDDLSLTRTYNSRSDRVGPFGPGWSSWATARLHPRPYGAQYEGPDGQRALFPRMGAHYGRVVGVNALVEPLESGLALSWFGGGRWEFDDAGLPVRIERGPGTEVRLRHDDQGRLVELAHRGRKRIELAWEGERIAAATCSDGRHVCYRYDEAANLVAVERAGGTRRYAIDDAARIVSVTDADGVVEVVNRYDEEGRVVEQRSPFGRTTRLSYLPGRVTVTDDDDDGPANTYIHDDAGRLLAIVDGNDQRMAFNYDQWGSPVVITERGGAVTIQEFDERARLLRRVLPTSGELKYAYDDADRVVEVSASNGAITRMRYAGEERSPCEIVDPEGGVSRLNVEGGLIREIIDPDGVRLRFEFDADGNVVAVLDADGNVARIERDVAGRATAAVTPLGRRTAFVYDDRGLLVERHDPGGGIWRYEHTVAGRLASVTDPTGAREEIRYGEHGSATAIIDPLGHVTAQSHDGFGNVADTVEPNGSTWTYGYDALMRLTTIDDPTGATWQREYDVDGNLVGSVDPTGIRSWATADPAGRVTTASDGLTSIAFEYDQFGRDVAQVTSDGAETRCAYDLCGRRIWIRDPLGALTLFAHSPGGRVIRRVAPSGRVDELQYDNCGRLAAQIDGAGRRWEYRYDADWALVERIEPTGEGLRLHYDDDGQVVEAYEPGSGVTRYAYDAGGRTTAIADRDAGSRTFAYDAAGRLIAAIDANGAVTRYAYDETGQLTEITDPLGATTTRSYDAIGRLVAETDSLGRTATLTYDAAGRIVEQADGSGRRTRWAYDAAGRLSCFGAAGAEPITIERDALRRKISIVEPGSFINELHWDPAGRLVERRRGDIAMRWRYTEDGERAAIGYPDGSETVFTHDAGGLLVAKQHPGLGSIEFERDAAGQLTGATGEGLRARWRYEGGDLVEYRFEAAGKVRSARLTRDGVGRIVEAIVDGGAQRFSYDPAGQLLTADTPLGSFSFSYDANGRLEREGSPAGTLEYQHDAAGQLILRRSDADSAATEYAYDGAGRRISEIGADVSRTWRWDNLGRLAHIETGRNDTSQSTTVVVDALGELASVDATSLMWDSADPTGPLAWMGQQAVVSHGSPWALAGGGTSAWLAPDWQGTIGDGARDPWGAAVDTSGPDVLRLGYRGEIEFDGQTWLRNRVYASSTRSFLSPDPWPPIPATASSANPYHYAANDPIGHSDPLGLRPVSEADFKKYRDRMGRNWLDKGWAFAKDNWEYGLAGVAFVGGLALIFTGVGAPAGLELLGVVAGSGALVGGGASIYQQKRKGEVNWSHVLIDSGAGAVVALATLGLARATAGVRFLGRYPALRGGLFGGATNVPVNMGARAMEGEKWNDRSGMEFDAALGIAVGAFGASRYAYHPEHARVSPGRHAPAKPRVDHPPSQSDPHPAISTRQPPRHRLPAPVGGPKHLRPPLINLRVR